MARILVHHASWLVTVDPERRIFTDGAIAIDGDRIAGIGKTADVARGFAADDVIDATGMLVLPGLVDTHIHNTQQLGRGLADDCDIPVQLLERLYGYEKVMTTEDALVAARLCQLELIHAGTTCFIDPSSYYPAETARAVGESGLRGIVARTAFDVHRTPIGALPSGMFRETTEEAVERAEATVATLNGTHGGRVRAWFALRILSGCSDVLCQRIKQLADKHRVGVILHASESRDEIVASRVTYGGGDVERLASLGALGPNMVLIHMGWASPREIALVQKHGCKISCTPSTSYRLGVGDMQFGRFPEMLELGVTVSLSSNSAMSSNFLDLVRVMGLGAGGMKSTRLDPTIMPPERMIEMATINGARAALWDDEIGSLEVGKKADLAMFDTRKPEWRPVLNPLANLVYASRGGAHTVVVDGKVLMRAGRVTTLDEARLLDEGQRRGEAIAERSALGPVTGPRWPIV